uniref:Putative terminase n=2 Tax=viral metagenome TaxID=1070528 RepID=A0A6H1ZMY6_9ZZZZ
MTNSATLDIMGLADKLAGSPTIPMVPKSSDFEMRRRYRLRIRNRIEELRNEAWRLFRPLPAVKTFFSSLAPVRLLDGSNQSGKSLLALMELVRAVCGVDPWGKYPKTNGRAIVVAYDGDHIADPIWSKLTREGEFFLIREPKTGRMRAVRPDPSNVRQLDPYDVEHESEWVPSPPLLPPRMVRDVAWEDRAKGIPRNVELTTGWKILFRSSRGTPPQGRQIHLALADEELNNCRGWVSELIPRLIRFGGKFIWSATPLGGGPELYELHEKAISGDSNVESFTLYLDDNPYITQEQKQLMLDLLVDPEERSVRYYGEYAIVGRKAYPGYDPMGIHGIEPFNVADHWCRIGVLDPGTQRLACIFGAIDPEERQRYLYDGFEMRQADAERWAQEVAYRAMGKPFDSFVIDMRAGRQRGLVGLMTTAEQYFLALEKAGVEVQRYGPLAGFFPGSDDMASREQALRGWLTVRGAGPFTGEPVLKVVKGILPELDRQIKLATTRPVSGKRVAREEGLLQCVEYWAAANLGYQRPRSKHPASTNIPELLLHPPKQQRGVRLASSIEIG